MLCEQIGEWAERGALDYSTAGQVERRIVEPGVLPCLLSSRQEEARAAVEVARRVRMRRRRCLAGG